MGEYVSIEQDVPYEEMRGIDKMKQHLSHFRDVERLKTLCAVS